MHYERGVTLLDTVVGTALMLVIFLGIAAAFQLSVDVVLNNKSRAAAIALADERMEYIRSLPYTAVGTVGGVPSGNLAQSEDVTLNGVTYVRRVFVVYQDDPKDGTGASDTTGIADYKTVKVQVSWNSRTGARSVSLVSRFEPSTGLESSVSGGTLTVNVVDAANQPVSNAQVHVVNSGASPAVNLTTYTNTNGSISLIGTPAASNYSVAVSKSGYSSAQTYSSSSGNPNPSPANLTISSSQTTSQTFAIDVLSSLTIITRDWGTGSTVGNVPIFLQGAKTIGSSPVVYKYSATVGGTGSPTTTVSSLEWDTYTMSATSSGYDIASACRPLPVSLSPGSSTTTTVYLTPHTTYSLPVLVVSNSTGALIPGASVRLYKTGYDTTQSTDSCGQTFFGGLSQSTYSISVSAAGYTTYTSSSVTVGTATAQYQVSLN